MNKKSIIIIAVSLSLMILLGFVFFMNNKDEALVNKDDFGHMIDGSYYVENGIEDSAEYAKNAMEEYLKQDPDELLSERVSRLGQYFKKESPVFKYSVEAKQFGRVTSIVSCELQETSICLMIMADIFVGESQKIFRNYWITLEKQTDKSFKALDLGVWE